MPPEYFRVTDRVSTNLRVYTGHVGRVDPLSDVRKPLMMLDFGNGQRMAFLPHELEGASAGQFDPFTKFEFNCREEGCFAHAKVQGLCQPHYAARRYQTKREGSR